MFVKPGTGFQKLLDKKPLRTTAYGDSKGLMLFRKFMTALHHCTGRRSGEYYSPSAVFSLKIISLE